MNWSHRLQEPRFWLLAIISAIAVLHLALVDRAGNSELFATSLLLWFAAGSLLWDRKQSLSFQSSPISSFVGMIVLAIAMLRVLSSPSSVASVWVLPLLCTIAVGLLASGFQGLRQYWRELIIFGLLALYPLMELALQALDMAVATAKAANFILGYFGIAVQREKDVFLYVLKNGSQVTSRVQVYGACSGIHNTLQMLLIAVLFLLLFPLKSQVQKLVCLAMAVTIGFLVNAFRVALMVILNDAGNKQAFDYWHEGTGSLIFSAIAVLLFGAFCWFCYLRKPPELPPSTGAGA
jgi:cyanoexosortase A